MQITVINVANQTVPTSKGSYQKLEVTYKGPDGKVGSRNIMSFVPQSKPAFEALVSASNGDVFDVSMVKEAGRDGKEYWVWTNATRGQAVISTARPEGGGIPVTTGTTKGNWETSEERAKKQIYIIRQSSISSAVAALAVGAKKPLEGNEVLALAKKFEDYVFEGLTGNVVTDTAALEDESLFQDIPL